MKCVITGDETNCLTKGKPLSNKGRELVQDYLDRFSLSELKPLGFILTRKMAMEDLFQGRDIMKEFATAKEKKAAEEGLRKLSDLGQELDKESDDPNAYMLSKEEMEELNENTDINTDDGL